MARVFSVAGGKGGVGKSVTSIMMARAFSEEGRKTVLVDADLGSANLHTLLSIRNPNRGVVDFLSGKEDSLTDILQRTSDKNVELISGSGDALGVANLKWAVKKKLISHLKKLGYERVIVDLGAGTSFNVLDIFLYTGEHVLVLGTEPTALQNMAEFMKHCVARLFSLQFHKQEHIAPTLNRFIHPSHGNPIATVGELFYKIREKDKKIAKEMEAVLKLFRPWVVVNNAENMSEAQRYFGIVRNYAAEYLQLDPRLLTVFVKSPEVGKAIKGHHSLLSHTVGGLSHGIIRLRQSISAPSGKASTATG